MIDGDGEIRWVRDEASRTTDSSGDPGWVQGVLVDITDRKTLETELKHLAFHDALTGLPNRALFRERVELAIAHATRTRSSFAVLYVDLDGFKAVNDSFGHRTGDEFLCEIAPRIQSKMRASDVVSREGGDEFAVLVADIPLCSEGFIRAIADQLGHEISRPVVIRGSGVAVAVAASIGIALFPKDGHSTDRMLDHADQAMYSAKAKRQTKAA